MRKRTYEHCILQACLLLFIATALPAAGTTLNQAVRIKKNHGPDRMVQVRLDDEQFSISATTVFPGTDIIISARSGTRTFRTIAGRFVVNKEVFEYPAFQDKERTFTLTIPIPPAMPAGNYSLEVNKLYEGADSETITFNITVKDSSLK